MFIQQIDSTEFSGVFYGVFFNACKSNFRLFPWAVMRATFVSLLSHSTVGLPCSLLSYSVQIKVMTKMTRKSAIMISNS